MSEKRFIINDGQTLKRISKREFEIRPFKDYDKPLNLREVLKLLNELDENYVDEYSLRETLQLELQKVEKENKELKKQMNRLYNYFMDWHSDEMGGNQFSEMWDIVKESEEWEKR